MSKALQKFPIFGLIMFVAVGLLSGFVASFVIDAIGAVGHVATIIMLSLLFLVWAYLTKTSMSPILLVYFVVMGLGMTVVASMLSDALNITDAILQSLLFFGSFFVVLVLFAKAPRQGALKR